MRQCEYPDCHAKATDTIIDVHHIIPRSDGGSDDPDNLMHLCRKHHRQVHSEAGDFSRWGRKGGQRTASSLVSFPNLKPFNGDIGAERFRTFLSRNHPDKLETFFS